LQSGPLSRGGTGAAILEPLPSTLWSYLFHV
jgi:hypothetical protein